MHVYTSAGLKMSERVDSCNTQKSSMEKKASTHGRRQRGSGPPWIFKHGTNIVDRGLKVLLFSLFCYFSAFFTIFSVFFSVAPPKTQIVLFFVIFCNFRSFFRWPPWKIFCCRPCFHILNYQYILVIDRIKYENECHGFYRVIEAADWLSAMLHLAQPISCHKNRGIRFRILF